MRTWLEPHAACTAVVGFTVLLAGCGSTPDKDNAIQVNGTASVTGRVTTNNMPEGKRKNREATTATNAQAGAPVKVYSVAHVVLAETTLAEGEYIEGGGVCNFPFALSVPKGENSYLIGLADQSAVEIKADDMAAPRGAARSRMNRTGTL